MTQKLSLFLLGGFLLLLLGCRHDLEQMDKVSTSESKAQKFSIFNFDKKTQRTPFDYAGAFAFLAQRYDSINHTNITGLVNTSNDVVYDSIKKQRFISSATEAYIEFRIHSQTVFEDNGDIWVVFPKIENNAVKELVVASLEEDETKVYYYRFDRFTDFHKENIEKFREVYAKYFHQAKSSSTGKMGVMSVCGTGVRPDCAIEEIVLPRPSKGGSKGGSGAWYGGDDGESAGGGGCGPHEMCAPPNGEGGGSYNPIPVNNTDPCAKMKEMNSNVKYMEKINELKKSSVLNKKYETGYSEDKNGNFTQLKTSSSTSSSDGLQLPINSNIKGFIHTHINDYEDGSTDGDGNLAIRQPIRMFSPADVNALMELAILQTDGNYSDLYGTMISSEGNYTIKFTGTAADIKTGFDTKVWRDEYLLFIKNESGSLEKKFLRFLSEKMGVKGVSLYKIKDNGVIQNKTLGSNNKMQSSDCP